MTAAFNDPSIEAIDGYLSAAFPLITENFGCGASGEQPLLVTALVGAMAQDFHTSAIVVLFGQLIDKLDEVVRALQSARNATS